MTKEDLIPRAIAYFQGNENEKILVTDDGQFFWPEHSHYARAHVGNKAERLFTITREEATEEAGEEKTKADLEKEIAAEKAQKIHDKYLEAIAKADELFTAKKWKEAIKKYDAASIIEPENEYPKGKIIEANDALNAK